MASSGTQLPHHVKSPVCGSRARYRDPRHQKAVKVYTINQESFYLLVQNVSVIGLADELRQLCDQYGIVEKFEKLNDYPSEDFSEAYLVKYKWFPAARTAKRQLDDKSFFGTNLHVCYAPEYETVSETREKLSERRRYIASKTRTGNNYESSSQSSLQKICTYAVNSDDCVPVPEPSDGSSNLEQINQPMTYIWAGKEYTYPSQPTSNVNVKETSSSAGDKDSLLSYCNASIKKKISSLSVPNSRISLKRKKRI